jgi:hypothetical protein
MKDMLHIYKVTLLKQTVLKQISVLSVYVIVNLSIVCSYMSAMTTTLYYPWTEVTIGVPGYRRGIIYQVAR